MRVSKLPVSQQSLLFWRHGTVFSAVFFFKEVPFPDGFNTAQQTTLS